MMGEHLLYRIADRLDYAITFARLTILDWLAPMPETPVDRAIREEGERLRLAFPAIDFDHPAPRRFKNRGETAT
jgi:hypothetical protein